MLFRSRYINDKFWDVDVGMMSGEIKFGIHAPPEGLDFEQMKRICLLAEDAGFWVLTITDHFQNMTRPDGSTGHPLEAWTLLGGLAAVTSRIKLGTLVSCVHYRHPTILAKMATTVDIISGGRVIFGVGAGWHQKEFEGFLGEFPPAKKRLDGLEDALNIAKSMFVNERTNYAGKVYSANNTLNLPLPVQRPIPMLVGGGGLQRTLKLAAKYADISHFAFVPQERRNVILQRIDALREHCKVIGRDYNEITKSVGLAVNLYPTRDQLEESAEQISIWGKMPIDEAREIAEKTCTTPEGLLDTINFYAEKDVTLFTAIFRKEKDIGLFAEEVMKEI